MCCGVRCMKSSGHHLEESVGEMNTYWFKCAGGQGWEYWECSKHYFYSVSDSYYRKNIQRCMSLFGDIFSFGINSFGCNEPKILKEHT